MLELEDKVFSKEDDCSVGANVPDTLEPEVQLLLDDKPLDVNPDETCSTVNG